MKNMFLPLLLAFTLLAGCSGGKYKVNDDGGELADDALLNKLTLFVEAVHEEKFSHALSFLTKEERSQMTEPDGSVSPNVQRQLKALRLSTLARNRSVKLVGGRIAGLFDQLPRQLQGDEPTTSPLSSESGSSESGYPPDSEEEQDKWLQQESIPLE